MNARTKTGAACAKSHALPHSMRLLVGIALVVALAGCGAKYPEGNAPQNALGRTASLQLDYQFVDLLKSGKVTVVGADDSAAAAAVAGFVALKQRMKASAEGVSFSSGPRARQGKGYCWTAAAGTVIILQDDLEIERNQFAKGSRLAKVEDWWCTE